MARQRELLSLVDIADETGISYATLRNYALKYGDEIPSEGSGRNTRYPRPAVKVFQRLRKESKPGRKPASATLPTLPQAAPVSTPAPVPVRQETLLSRLRFPVPAPVAAAPAIASTASPTTSPAVVVDNSGLEKELAAIRGYLANIADSLKRLATAAETSAAPAAAPTPAETPASAPTAMTSSAPMATPAAATVPAPATAGKDLIGAAVPLPELRDGSSGSEKPGQRRLQSMPKVWGQRGRRPE